ncbi:PA14 domain-containing protein [Georgenia sp. Marseille-Q6866]
MTVGATSALGLPIDEVPTDPSEWATTPYSPLGPGSIAAPDNTVELDFTGTEGGLNTSGDVGTGFTMIQPSSADSTYYLPQNLSVSDSKLNILATQGIAHANAAGATGDVNKQDNTLGVGVDATDAILRFTTTLESPSGVYGSAQGGLWFGPNDDNYVKLAVLGNGTQSNTSGRQIQLSRETNGAVPNATTDQRTLTTTAAALGTGPVTLQLDVNAVAETITGSYRLGSGPAVSLGAPLALPENFIDATLLSATVPNVTAFGGIFATKRNMPANSEVTYSFTDFSVKEMTPPASPAGLEAVTSPANVLLSWDAADVSSDVVGYRVYRGTTTPVATSGPGLGGDAPLTTPEFEDDSTFVGETYHYAIVAVDSDGSVSAPAETEATVPEVDAELVERINFQTGDIGPPAGYTADTGLAYSADRGFGWIAADDGTPLDNTANVRLREGAGITPDLRLATIAHMDIPNGSVEEGVWEYDLPNGSYTVVTAVGDGANYDSTHVVRAEGTTILDGFVGTASRQFDEVVGTVEVEDGTLTIDQVGGNNTKLAYVEIYANADEVAAPAAPSDVSATHGASGVTVEWSGSEGADSYNVLRAADADSLADASPINSEPVTGTEYLDETVEAGESYVYAIVAVNTGGTSPISEHVVVDVPAAPTAPAAPADLAGDVTESGVSLSWTESDGATGYVVYRSEDEGTLTEGEPLAEVTEPTYLDEDVTAGTTYVYGVVAMNDAGESDVATVEVAVPEQAPEAPAAPGGVAATVRTDGAIELRWDAAERAEGYNVYRGIGAPATTADQPINGTTPVTGLALVDQDVQPGTTYHYLVVAVGDGSATPAASQAVVTTPPAAPACPEGLWAAEYFDGRELEGEAVSRECLSAVDKNWYNSGSPAGLESNDFSARFTTTVNEGAGTYEFQAQADDGVRVYVDDELVIDKWGTGDYSRLHTGSIELTDGPHEFVVEYFEAAGAARVTVDYFKVQPGEGPACEPGLWAAEYFDGRELEGEAVSRECLSAVDKNWYNSGSPAGLESNDFSARFTTTVNEGAGTYEFQAQADDGVRVYVDDELVIDKWGTGDYSRLHTGSIELTDGPHEFVVEYFEAAGAARVTVDYFKVQPGEGPACEPGLWAAEYFDGRELEGEAVSRECLSAVDKNWYNSGSPAGLESNDFSARFTTTVNEGAGTYEFQAQADDGVRVYVDDELVIDKWGTGDYSRLHTGSIELTDGPHEFVVEYFEAAGAARVTVDYFKVQPGEGPACEPGLWAAEYFDGRELEGEAVSRECLSAVDKNWYNSGSPAGLESNDFSARFTTTVNEGAGTYEFQAQADDGVRVYVDDELVIDKWGTGDYSRLHTGSIELTDGPHEFVVEYFEAAGAARVTVSYERTGAVDVTAPVAPTVLTATATDTVQLGWQASVSEDTLGYRVYRSLEQGVVTEGVAYSGETLLGDTSFFDPNVDPGQTYYYVVTAVDAAGNESVASNEVEVTLEQILPPTDVAASAGAETIGVTWTASATTSVVGYYVYRGTEAGVTADGAPISGADPVMGTSFTDNTAEVGKAYFYAVVAVDGEGRMSDLSNEVVAQILETPDTEAPAAPAELAGTAGDGVVDLSWTASDSEDVAGYRIHRALEPEVGTSTTTEVVSGEGLVLEPTYTDMSVTNGTTYHYAVEAVDRAGNTSELSNVVMAVPRVPNTLDVKVDFATASATPVEGYVLDYGQPFGARTGANQGTGLTYGWTTEDGNPVSLVGNGRIRVHDDVDPNLNSIIHMQYGDVDGTNGVDIPGTWELAVPDGLYEVTVAVGDERGTNGYDSTHVLNIEAGVGIESFVATDAEQFRTATVTVGVWDGALTINPVGGTNTKLAYVEVVGQPLAPHVDTVLPDNRSVDHDVTAGVSSTIRIPYAGVGVDPTTLQGNVHLYELPSGTQVPVQVGTSGGNDVISLSPDQPLKANTGYRFVVTSNVKDNLGAAFLPFTSVFTTGEGEIGGGGSDEFTPLKNIEFEQVELPIGAGKYWASFAFGPDGKLYATTIGQGLFRFDVAEDGTLSNMTNLGYQGRAMVGLVFDRDATADDLRLWVTSTSANIGNETDEWISGVSLLTGDDLGTEHKVFTSLPRSRTDHLTNSIAYGPDGRLYFLQGSNQAAGDLDDAWGQRGEKLLTAATLVFDQDHPQVAAAIDGGPAIDVKTADGGTYDPFAENAPLEIFATGIRNAYDLAWHSNGHLYVPTNGTAGGANSPGVTVNSDGTFTREAASGIPGFSEVDGLDATEACLDRRIDGEEYTGGNVPPIKGHPTQQDHLYRVEEGGYYGHPNPERCEWVLHEGNDPANPPQYAGQGGSRYPSGVKADPNYRGVEWNLGFNKSPNGVLEYKSETFGGQLEGRLVVIRFSQNDDLLFLQVDSETGEVLGEQTSAGLTGVPDTTMSGVSGFDDPLEIVEDPNNGNLYVNQYDRGGSNQKLYLLRVPEDQRAPSMAVSADELVYSTVVNTTSAGKSLIVTNESTESVTLGRTLVGSHPGEFTVTGGATTLAAGQSTTITVAFKPGSTAGQRSAVLRLTGGDQTIDVGLYGLAMQGIEGGNEPSLHNVLGTLGYNVNVGWTNLAGGMNPAARGEEVLEPLFVKAGTAPVNMRPLAHYAPKEHLPFGWYTGDGGASERNIIAQIDTSGYQSLLPPITTGGSTNFDPGTAEFGFFYRSDKFDRFGYTEDRLNSPAADAHRARIYPAKDREGTLIRNAYIVAFEDASNGDYQDYLFLVTGVRPAGEAPVEPVGDPIRINFSNEAAALPSGYLRDFGQPFGARTRTDQGTGLSYGWKNQANGQVIDLSVGGTSGPGNGRDRNTSQSDQRLDTLMHMQSQDVTNNGNTFNGVSAYAYWELALPEGSYRVTVAAGDPSVNSDPESHVINLEGERVIDPFVPSGNAGSNTRHTTATADVDVEDGFLTVTAVGGTNTKINYIDVVPLDVDEGPDDPGDGAAVKVNFQTAGAPTPSGWTADTGAAFDAEAGFGWLVGTSPADRSDSMRYRTGPTSGVTFINDPLLQTFTILDNNQVTSLTNGTWEYEVPNGTYEVAAAVGDSGYTDSTHTVLAEGQPVITGFVPTNTNPHQTGVRTVEVTDGRLTITSGGHNTKLAWVTIDGEGLGGEEPTPTETVQVAFAPATAPTTPGWTVEAGEAYSATRGYGWLNAATGQPADRTAATRYRATPTGSIAFPTENVRKSFAFLDNATQPTYTNGTWEYALGNGTYGVEVSVGDAGYTDSVHGVTVEGVEIVKSFAPSNATPFTTGSGTVTVTDGKLTMTNSGDNTKVNWIRITGSALLKPSVTVTANGVALADSYSGGPAEIAISADAPGGSTLESLTYTVDGGEPVDYTEPFTLGLGEHVLEVTATDSEGRTTVRAISLEILDVGGTMSIRNEQATRQGGAPIPGMSEDWITLHRINSGVVAHKVIDKATVTVTNTGTKDLRITDVSLGGSNATQFTVTGAPTAPFVVAPGDSLPLEVTFTANSGSKGIRAAQLVLTSSDPTNPIMTIQVRGGYMTAPEGGNELSLNQLAALYGWTTDIGNLKNGDEMRTSPLNGDEVRSLQWKKADPSQPVVVRQLAAFHGCCGQQETINIGGTTVTHAAAYGQSILPLTNQGNPTQLSANPSGNFGIVVSGQTTNNANYMASKTWPVIDRNGDAVAGAWIVGHDYISSPNQCGIGATNCDFQDNVYLITNVLPVTPHSATAPAAPAGLAAEVGDGSVELSWTATDEDLVVGYHVERALSESGPWSRLTGGTPVTGTSFTDASTPAAATGYYRVLAVDISGTVSTTATPVEVELPDVDEAPIRINSGGGAVTTGGVQWLADTMFNGGKIFSNSSVTSIAGTTDDVLYFTERSAAGTFGYDIGVNGGEYIVRLHFAEIYHGAPGGGSGGLNKRVFSVNLEGGATEIVNLDLNSQVAPATAHVVDVPITVTDGNLDIDFSATVDQPKVSAIEVIPAG